MVEVTLNPSIDAWIDLSNPNTNNNDTNLWFGELDTAVGQTTRTLVKFDVSSIPAGSMINSATLSFYINLDRSSNARTARVRYLKRDWVEGEATWNIYSTGNNWETAGASGANDVDSTDLATASYTATESTGAYKDFTLNDSGLSVINRWVNGNLSNYGFRVTMDTELNDAYRHDSSGNTNKPKLVINYTKASINPMFFGLNVTVG